MTVQGQDICDVRQERRDAVRGVDGRVPAARQVFQAANVRDAGLDTFQGVDTGAVLAVRQPDVRCDACQFRRQGLAGLPVVRGEPNLRPRPLDYRRAVLRIGDTRAVGFEVLQTPVR